MRSGSPGTPGSSAGEAARDLAGQVLDRLRADGQTVAVAESLTGGMVASRLTDTPGASATFRGGVVVYATDLKADLLGADVATHGAVSSETAAALAEGVRERLGSTWGLSTTGVAGPDEQEGQPVGTLHVGLAGPMGTVTRALRVPAADRAHVVPRVDVGHLVAQIARRDHPRGDRRRDHADAIADRHLICAVEDAHRGRPWVRVKQSFLDRARMNAVKRDAITVAPVAPESFDARRMISRRHDCFSRWKLSRPAIAPT